ncbi:helix-turn-helix domain-containing protein [Pseudomonas palleroniana]|uniref:helix-turn-helix domain-containing protein n=1 Tax=Pseudomonas palleroniana TaxID=191390 RepID=UPI0018E69B61|nr:helix-turn-helix transcriptional regulator [Pseudomonas palleroniana]MBI6909784.1 helix-turn-helix transcriptional regulator [Pseudomonas palleroniana]
MSLRQSFAETLQMLRQRKGITQQSMTCRLDQTTISKVESGKHSVTLDVSQKLATALDLELTALVALTASRDGKRTPREVLLASLAEIEALELADANLASEPYSKVPLNILSARDKWQAVQALKEQGLTQGEAAKQLEMPESTLRRLWHQVSKE